MGGAGGSEGGHLGASGLLRVVISSMRLAILHATAAGHRDITY
jgi:hypothetical protein